MQTTTSSTTTLGREQEEEEVTEKEDLEMIEQMRTMEIMKKDSSVVPALSDPVSSDLNSEEEEEEEEEGSDEATESFANFETTTVIATSISTSEAISYYTSVSLPKSDS